MMPQGLATLQAEWLAQHGLPSPVGFAPSLSDSASVTQVVPMAAETPTHELPYLGHYGAPASPEDDADPMAHLLAIPGGSFTLPVTGFSPAPLSASNDEINEVERAILLAQGIQMLPPEGISLKQHLVEVERSLIEQALARTQGNVSQTAKLLQLQRTTLIEKINKYELRDFG